MLAAYVATRPATHLLFADEAWWGLTTELGRVWARGPRPVLAVSGGRSWTPVLAAAEPAAGRLHALIAGRFDARWCGRFLAEVAAAYPGERVILVLDNAGWHAARDLAVPDNAIVWCLPPPCPEANPVEQLWRWLRDRHTRGEPFRDRAAPLAALCRGLRGLLDDPARVRALTGGPSLPDSFTAFAGWWRPGRPRVGATAGDDRGRADGPASGAPGAPR